MRLAANPMMHRWLALLCLCLTLLTAIPRTAALAPEAMTPAAMAGCAPCCKSSPIAVNRLCCQTDPRPVQGVSSSRSNEAILASRPATTPGTTAVLALTDTPTPHRPAPHPPLHPILRI